MSVAKRRAFPETFGREAVDCVISSGFPIKFGFVDGRRKVWPVRVTCAILGLPASGSVTLALPG